MSFWHSREIQEKKINCDKAMLEYYMHRICIRTRSVWTEWWTAQTVGITLSWWHVGTMIPWKRANICHKKHLPGQGRSSSQSWACPPWSGGWLPHQKVVSPSEPLRALEPINIGRKRDQQERHASWFPGTFFCAHLIGGWRGASMQSRLMLGTCRDTEASDGSAVGVVKPQPSVR